MMMSVLLHDEDAAFDIRLTADIDADVVAEDDL